MLRLSHGGDTINDVDSWREHAPPKSPSHWADGRSAKELARAWCGENGVPGIPPEIDDILHSHPATVSIVIEEMVPEFLVSFDAYPGGVRNADLMGIGTRPDGSMVAISIEGKCDEVFDATLGSVRKRAQKIHDSGGRTNANARVDDLVKSLLGADPVTTMTDKLRYQLFTGVAGTLAYARNMKVDTAVFIIHEFRSSLAKQRALARNARDLQSFVVALTGGVIQDIPEGQLIGPIRIPGVPLFESPPPLLLGKATREVGLSDGRP